MKLAPDRIEEIQGLIKGDCRTNVSLSEFTSFRIGGPADLLVEPADSEEMAAVLSYVRAERIPSIVLGSGTNILFNDRGFRGIVIRTTSMSGFELLRNGSEHARITVSAGFPLQRLVSRSAKLGWTGFEPLWGIPGSFGGAVVMNAGARGACIGDYIEHLKVVDRKGKERHYEKEHLRFSYRSADSIVGTVVVEGTVRLAREKPEAIETELEKSRSARRASQPLDAQSAGCVFKNPSKGKPAGMLIDALGFKGSRVGGAEVSRVHANFIINAGGATAHDVLELIEKIRARVREAEGIDLDLEIRVIGEEGVYV
jgi:UDP-N-acetylmuramate dehydrogenase